MLTFEAGSMPKLEEFHLDFDADITISVSNGRLDFGIKHLSQLTHFGCDMFGTELSIFLVEDAIKKEIDNHPNLPYFAKFHFPSTTELALPTDLSFTIHHHGASPGLGHRHGQQRRRSKARQGATIRGRELVQGAPLIPDRLKGASGATTATSNVLGPRLIAAPQQQEAIVPPCFTFSSGSLPNAEAEQQAMDRYKPSQRDDLANAFSRAFDGLSLRTDHHGSSATAVEAASSNTGAAPTSDVLGPQHIAAPQQHALVAPCFTFSSRSPPIAEAEQQAMDSYEPSQHDDLANAFSSAFNGLSLRNDHPGSSAMAVEASSSDTGSSCQGGGRQEEQQSDR